MSDIKSLFATRLYHAKLSEHGKPVDAAELENSCLVIADDDEAGQEWCEENGYPGYTSYASLTDLPWRFPIFKDLVKVLDAHVAAFAKDVQFDLGDKKLVLEDIWINILPEGGIHTGHIHPHSVISGTTYEENARFGLFTFRDNGGSLKQSITPGNTQTVINAITVALKNSPLNA
ncbi:MAG: TIGR02466 family protein, partial [Paracoccaceae bacterium]|nr:TIGR02466 family protein [Paracoccaceae bacterium]